MYTRNAWVYLLIISLITLSLWIFSKNSLTEITTQPLVSISQVLALLGLPLIAVNLFIATRLGIAQKLFGQLDEIYRFHHTVGSLAFIFLIFHPIGLAASAFPNVTLYFLPGSDLAYNAGIFAIQTMILAFIFMVFIKLPYHLWRWTHRLLAVTFILGSYHALTIGSDIAQSLPLKLWIIGFIILGNLSTVYILFLYRLYSPHARYRITRLKMLQDIITVWLKPLGQKLDYQPGQFAFAVFQNPFISKEPHPYSFTSDPKEDEVSFSIKILGDHTAQLRNLKAGDKATLYGPYGGFGQAYTQSRDDQVWIAGGIGLTPFKSLLKNRKQKDTNKVTLFYSYNRDYEQELVYDLETLTRNTQDVEIIPWFSPQKGRLTGEEIAKTIPDVTKRTVLLCGPVPMMESLSLQLNKLGVSKDKIHFENFDLV